MSDPQRPVPCPGCGGPMNRHAEKVITPKSEAEVAKMDVVFGGNLAVFYSCSPCGATHAFER